MYEKVKNLQNYNFYIGVPIYEDKSSSYLRR